MADDSPEKSRRNLVVTSWLFIVFCAADGFIPLDSNFRLVIVEVEFNREWVLVLGAWTMLGWYAFRYYQYNSTATSNALQGFPHYVNKKREQYPFLISWLEKKFGGKHEEVQGFRHSIGGPWYKLNIHIDYIPENLESDRKEIISIEPYHPIWMRLFADYTIKQTEILEFVAPFVWALLAVVLAVPKTVQWILI